MSDLNCYAPAASACATLRIAAFLHFDTKETSWAGPESEALLDRTVSKLGKPAPSI